MITDFTSIKLSDFVNKNESFFSDNEESHSSEEMISENNYAKIFDILNFKEISIEEKEDDIKENESQIKKKRIYLW